MDESDTQTLPLLSAAASTTTPLEISSESEPRRLPTFCLILTPIVILIPLLFVLAIFLPTVEHSGTDNSGPPKDEDGRGNNSTPFIFGEGDFMCSFSRKVRNVRSHLAACHLSQ